MAEPEHRRRRTWAERRGEIYPGRHAQADQRLRSSRRYKACCKALTAECGGDPTAGTLALITATAAAMVEIEAIQVRVLHGEADRGDRSDLTRLGNLITRNLGVLGLRTRRKAGPSLQDYIARSEKADADG